jgi:hypothetical protein
MHSPIFLSVKFLLQHILARLQVRRVVLLITPACILTCFALSSTPKAFGVNPPPDGGYPNFNTAEGDSALLNLSSGTNNTAIGANALESDISGSANTATGNGALANNTASNNTAVGFEALLNNTTGSENTASGVDALLNNTAGRDNTATGFEALYRNTTGFNNTATGFQALQTNTTGLSNTATGSGALLSNTTGASNTATGADALLSNTSGSSNSAIGSAALFHNTTGTNNTATGADALLSNTSGSSNSAIGVDALFDNTTGNNNTAEGVSALTRNTTGNNNIALGTSAGANLTTGSNNIDIGANVLGKAAEANTIRIGKQGTQTSTIIAGISGTAVAGSTVVVSTTGKLGVASSSARFKTAINPMSNASEAILGLKPVTFRYKEDIDPDAIPQFGLVAEEVEKVNPDLVVHDEAGKPYTVRYEAVNAMLLNEFLKARQQIDQQEKQIEALTAGLEKVNAKVELHSPATRTAATN